MTSGRFTGRIRAVTKAGSIQSRIQLRACRPPGRQSPLYNIHPNMSIKQEAIPPKNHTHNLRLLENYNLSVNLSLYPPTYQGTWKTTTCPSIHPHLPHPAKISPLPPRTPGSKKLNGSCSNSHNSNPINTQKQTTGQ